MWYLAAGNGEIGKNAVFFVFMARVSFQTLALGVVPQFQCVVQCSCQNVFAVGGKFDERNGWVVVVNQRLEALTRSRVPDATITITISINENLEQVAIANELESTRLMETTTVKVKQILITIIHRSWMKQSEIHLC